MRFHRVESHLDGKSALAEAITNPGSHITPLTEGGSLPDCRRVDEQPRRVLAHLQDARH